MLEKASKSHGAGALIWDQLLLRVPVQIIKITLIEATFDYFFYISSNWLQNAMEKKDRNTSMNINSKQMII